MEKSYLVYPGTGIIRQWTRYENTSSQPIKVHDPSFLSFRAEVNEANRPVFNYMTGGGYYTGSQI